jgi:hypothetical protein
MDARFIMVRQHWALIYPHYQCVAITGVARPDLVLAKLGPLAT